MEYHQATAKHASQRSEIVGVDAEAVIYACRIGQDHQLHYLVSRWLTPNLCA